jgi:hypothetical protein
MFTIEEIDARLRATPFVPLRIMTSAGEAYEITQPELVVLGERFMIIGIVSSKHPRAAGQFSRVAFDHITAMDDFPVPMAAAA